MHRTGTQYVGIDPKDWQFPNDIPMPGVQARADGSQKPLEGFPQRRILTAKGSTPKAEDAGHLQQSHAVTGRRRALRKVAHTELSDLADQCAGHCMIAWPEVIPHLQ